MKGLFGGANEFVIISKSKTRQVLKTCRVKSRVIILKYSIVLC